MDPWVLNLFESVIFLGMTFLVIQYLIPKSIRYFLQWRSSRNETDLKRFVGMGVLAFFFFSAVFIMFLKPFIKY